MSTEVKKGDVIRAVLSQLGSVPDAPPLDPGAMVLFLEREAATSMLPETNTIDVGPLWAFFQEQGQWTFAHCQEITQRIQEQITEHSVTWLIPDLDAVPSMEEIIAASQASLPAMPAAEPPVVEAPAETPAEASDEASEEPSTTSKASWSSWSLTKEPASEEGASEAAESTDTPGEILEGHSLFQQQKPAILAWVVEGASHSTLDEIIDPEKLEAFLAEAIDEIWEEDKVQLQTLWDFLSEPEGVTQTMLFQDFLWMEAMQPEEITVPIGWPMMVTQLSTPLRNKFLINLGLPPVERGMSGSFSSFSNDGLPAASGSQSGSYAATSGSFGRASGSHAALTSGSGPAAPKYEQSAFNQRSKKEAERAAREEKRAAKKKEAKKKLEIPVWSVAVVLVVLALGYYFFLYNPNISQKTLNPNDYSHIVPLQSLRIIGPFLHVHPTAAYYKEPFKVRSPKVVKMFREVQSSYTNLHTLILYRTNGQVKGSWRIKRR